MKGKVTDIFGHLLSIYVRTFIFCASGSPDFDDLYLTMILGNVDLNPIPHRHFE